MIVPNMGGGGAVRHIQRGHVTYDPGNITLKTTVRLTKGDLKNIVFTPYSTLTLTMADCGFQVFQGSKNESLELKSKRSNGIGSVTFNEIKNRKADSGSPIYLCIPDPGYLHYYNKGLNGNFGNNNTVLEIIENILYPKLLNSVYSVNDIGSIQITLTGFKALDKMGYVFTNLSQDANTNKELCKIESFTPNKLIYASEERTSIDAKLETTDCIYGWMNDAYNKPCCCFEPINMDYWEFLNGNSKSSVIWLKDNCPDSIEVLETTYTKDYAVKTKMFFDYQVIEYS